MRISDWSSRRVLFRSVEGYGGPDFILGAGGNDSLYGGSQELHQQQAETMLGHAQQMHETVFDGGEGAQSAAELNHYRSEERRVGQEGDRTCRARGSPEN